MSFEWKEFLELANELINSQKASLNEARFRTSISRSYYAAFGLAAIWLTKRGLQIPRGETHKFVQEEFINSPKSIEKRIGKNLKSLWLDRKEADYDPNAEINEDRAQIAYLTSFRVLPWLQKGLEDELKKTKTDSNKTI